MEEFRVSPVPFGVLLGLHRRAAVSLSSVSRKKESIETYSVTKLLCFQLILASTVTFLFANAGDQKLAKS